MNRFPPTYAMREVELLDPTTVDLHSTLGLLKTQIISFGGFSNVMLRLAVCITSIILAGTLVCTTHNLICSSQNFHKIQLLLALVAYISPLRSQSFFAACSNTTAIDTFSSPLRASLEVAPPLLFAPSKATN